MERRRSNPVCISIAWYRTLTLFVEWRIIQSSLDRRYFNNLIAFILCVKIIATSDDWRSKSRECYLEGSKWKTGHQVGQCLVHVTKSIFMYRRFIGVVFVLCSPNLFLYWYVFVFFCHSSAFDAERERQHRAKYRQMEVRCQFASKETQKTHSVRKQTLVDR